MSIPEDTVKERLTLRRTDPVTGQRLHFLSSVALITAVFLRYHMLLRPPLSLEISSRLLTVSHYIDG